MEVPARFVREFIRASGEFGIDIEPLLADLGIRSVHDLDDQFARVEWASFAGVTERVRATLADDARLEELGARTAALSSSWVLARLGAYAIDPALLFRVTFRWLGPMIFPHIQQAVTELPDRTIRLELSIPLSYVASESFFLLTLGSFRALPTLVGHPPALVMTESLGPRGAVYVVTPPPSRTLLGRLGRAIHAIRGERALFEQMSHDQQVIQQAYAALMRTQHELRQFMERIPDPLIVQREGVIVWANAALLEALEYASLDELRGTRIEDIVHPAEREAAAARVGAPVSRAPMVTMRVRVTDGTFRTFEISPPQAVVFEGRPARMTLGRDVTERDALREQLVLADRMAQLGFLAAGVAHEINNPLAYAIASLDRARAELARNDMSAAQEAIATAREGADRVRAITRDLHVFARGSEKRLDQVDVLAVLRATVGLAAASVRTRGRLDTSLEALPAVRGDAGRLGQVFMNLLVNAIDALSEEGAETNRIDVRAFTSDEGWAVVEVRDNGQGIPDAARPHIFQPFFTTKGPGAGSGLGLAICDRIVQEVGGRIEVESTPGRGATFRVVLPPDSSTALEEPRPVPREGRRLRVLVVDDEPVLARLTGMMLEPHHDVDVVTRGDEAIERMERGPPYDVVLCDLMMSGMGGIDVYEAVEARWPGMGRRMIFMTGGAFTERAQRFLARVKNPCVDKPFTEAGLVEAVAAVARGGA